MDRTMRDGWAPGRCATPPVTEFGRLLGLGRGGSGAVSGVRGLLPWVLRFIPVVLVVGQTLGNGGLSGGHAAGAIALLAVVAGAWAWLLLGPGPYQTDQAALVVAVGAAAGLEVLTNAGQVYVIGYAALFIGPFFYGLPEAIPSAVAGVAAVGLSTGLVGRPDLLGGLSNTAGAFFFGLAALSWGRVMRESRRNAELVVELQSSRDAEQRNAVAAERARLARELHDVLAHTLSSLALHLESTRALADNRTVDPEVADRLRAAVALARTGLDEARTAVGTLRDDALPGPDRLAALVEQFAATSGIDCRFTETGEPRSLGPQARVALFRATQEGLSNVAKHARPSRVDVCLEWTPDAVTLRVDDRDETRIATGPAARAPAGVDAGGNGLRGMQERAELAGGRVEAAPTRDGFSLVVSLPA